jgi:tRNA nucleotidyltransferase (CCA-adding enzyme)
MLRLQRSGLPARLVARFLIVVFSVMSPAAVHQTSEVDECQPASIAHDADAHRFVRADTPLTDSDHCWLCHWSRAFRSSPSSSAFTPRPSFVGGRLLQDSSAWAAHLASARIPARSPPVSSFI